MLEGEFNRKLKRALEQHPALRNAWIVKHNDMSTGGIPDISVTLGRHTEWFEVKMKGETPTKLQRWTLGRIGCDASAVITASLDGREALITPLETLVGWMTFSQLVEEIVSRCVV